MAEPAFDSVKPSNSRPIPIVQPPVPSNAGVRSICTPQWSLSRTRSLRVRFDDLSIAEQEVLTVQLYSRADSWLGWGEGRESDNVLRSLGRIFTISMRGLKATALSLVGRDDPGRPP